ncbi:hypothetical protein EYF80_047759 [Liparis tanakae]|uniref:Uncharacterized protein n=1 Tax=Liparis tanakae TaxID=230148 RepID=A0A4Z2FLQ2_9TELE|nr:hypothetical protein EYF80_047759 [Liparis tanakae]
MAICASDTAIGGLWAKYPTIGGGGDTQGEPREECPEHCSIRLVEHLLLQLQHSSSQEASRPVFTSQFELLDSVLG